MPERLTSQKKLILDYLKESKDHPSADEIYNNVKEKLPRISRGTVYRIINGLKDKESVQSIPVKGISRFDGDTSPHAHFICRNCGMVFDVLETCSGCNILKKKRIKVGKINYFKIYFYGICKKCSS